MFESAPWPCSCETRKNIESFLHPIPRRVSHQLTHFYTREHQQTSPGSFLMSTSTIPEGCLLRSRSNVSFLCICWWDSLKECFIFLFCVCPCVVIVGSRLEHIISYFKTFLTFEHIAYKGSCYVAQTGLEHMSLNDIPSTAFYIAVVIGMDPLYNFIMSFLQKCIKVEMLIKQCEWFYYIEGVGSTGVEIRNDNKSWQVTVLEWLIVVRILLPKTWDRFDIKWRIRPADRLMYLCSPFSHNSYHKGLHEGNCRTLARAHCANGLRQQREPRMQADTDVSISLPILTYDV